MEIICCQSRAISSQQRSGEKFILVNQCQNDKKIQHVSRGTTHNKQDLRTCVYKLNNRGSDEDFKTKKIEGRATHPLKHFE